MIQAEGQNYHKHFFTRWRSTNRLRGLYNNDDNDIEDNDDNEDNDDVDYHNDNYRGKKIQAEAQSLLFIVINLVHFLLPGHCFIAVQALMSQ